LGIKSDAGIEDIKTVLTKLNEDWKIFLTNHWKKYVNQLFK
jgi:hypothetical protein